MAYPTIAPPAVVSLHLYFGTNPNLRQCVIGKNDLWLNVKGNYIFFKGKIIGFRLK